MVKIAFSISVFILFIYTSRYIGKVILFIHAFIIVLVSYLRANRL